jgi:hypothetical protein
MAHASSVSDSGRWPRLRPRSTRRPRTRPSIPGLQRPSRAADPIEYRARFELVAARRSVKHCLRTVGVEYRLTGHALAATLPPPAAAGGPLWRNDADSAPRPPPPSWPAGPGHKFVPAPRRCACIGAVLVSDRMFSPCARLSQGCLCPIAHDVCASSHMCWSGRRLRDSNPGWAVNPNRISSWGPCGNAAPA